MSWSVTEEEDRTSEREEVTDERRKRDLRPGFGEKEGESRREEGQKGEIIAIWYMEEVHRVHGSLSLFCLSSFYLFAFHLMTEH